MAHEFLTNIAISECALDVIAEGLLELAWIYEGHNNRYFIYDNEKKVYLSLIDIAGVAYAVAEYLWEERHGS